MSHAMTDEMQMVQEKEQEGRHAGELQDIEGRDLGTGLTIDISDETPPTLVCPLSPTLSEVSGHPNRQPCLSQVS
jgi:hypothetical protein